jgi:hypothetical protein
MPAGDVTQSHPGRFGLDAPSNSGMMTKPILSDRGLVLQC